MSDSNDASSKVIRDLQWVSEVGEILGLSRDGVAKRLMEARRRLKALLDSKVMEGDDELRS